ncbi:hypothetical protein GCM10017784_18040 [Deinococcus indicus]|nr:hypothetical protein GCM10017784_18040 [Deinococcus indicus]
MQPIQSERMRLVELPRRAGEKRVPDVEPAGAVKFRIVGETNGSPYEVDGQPPVRAAVPARQGQVVPTLSWQAVTAARGATMP